MQLPCACAVKFKMNCTICKCICLPQLIYEINEGLGTIQLLTLKPDELNEEITKKFEVLGIEIPDMKYVHIIVN